MSLFFINTDGIVLLYVLTYLAFKDEGGYAFDINCRFFF